MFTCTLNIKTNIIIWFTTCKMHTIWSFVQGIPYCMSVEDPKDYFEVGFVEIGSSIPGIS